MSTYPIHAVPGYQFEATPELNDLKTRERLSHPAIEGFFAIMDKWGVTMEQAGELLGGRPRSSVYKLKSLPKTLGLDELTRISYLVGIYKALHILLPDDLADQWMTRPNDDPLFRGRPPLEYVLRGIPAMQQVRSLVDAARGGR
jgi:hypothetical protein